jgi:nucleoside 2-deoxyribosyltransferase
MTRWIPPRVYLAGPDVFHPHHRQIFAEREACCRRAGLEPLVPLDSTATTPLEIYRSNVRLLNVADLLIANITPFRGPHCDVGTAWEIGYAVCRGVPVFAFSAATGTLLDRVGRETHSPQRDALGMLVEDFGLPENLMLAYSFVDQQVHETFVAALEAAARRMKSGLG